MHKFNEYLSVRSNFFYANLFGDKDEVAFLNWIRRLSLIERRVKEAVEMLPEREKKLLLQVMNGPHCFNPLAIPYFADESNQNYAVLLTNRAGAFVSDYLRRFGYSVNMPHISFALDSNTEVQEEDEECNEDDPENFIVEDPLLPYREKARRLNVAPELLYDFDNLQRQAPAAATLSEKELYERIKKLCAENDLPEELEFHMLTSAAEYLREGTSSPILLVGNPGIGKTYYGHVFADILGLHYYKISAPGATCGRGLSGDSPTYKAARYGEIVNAQIQAKATNPVVLVDEVDKCATLGSHHQINDELLGCLDGTRTIKDHFIEMEVDTSPIPFILTANDMKRVPSWLIDRCITVEFPDPDVDRIISITMKKFEKLKGNALYLNRISMDPEAFRDVVTAQRKTGIVSLRQYEALIQSAAKVAHLELLESGKDSVVITSRHFSKAMSMFNKPANERKIGFRVA